MKTQIVYKAKLDYEASYLKLKDSNLGTIEQTQKGLIWFRFKDTKTVFMISPYGRIEVAWENPQEKKVLLKVLKNLLVPKEGEKLRIKPVKQIREFSYPPPPNFKLSWCDEETEYRKQSAKRMSSKYKRQLSLGLKSILAEDWQLYRPYEDRSEVRARWREEIEYEGIRFKELATEYLRKNYPSTYDKMQRRRKLKERAKEALLMEGKTERDAEAIINFVSFAEGDPKKSEESEKLLEQWKKAYQDFASDIERILLTLE